MYIVFMLVCGEANITKQLFHNKIRCVVLDTKTEGKEVTFLKSYI